MTLDDEYGWACSCGGSFPASTSLQGHCEIRTLDLPRDHTLYFVGAYPLKDAALREVFGKQPPDGTEQSLSVLTKLGLCERHSAAGRGSVVLAPRAIMRAFGCSEQLARERILRAIDGASEEQRDAAAWLVLNSQPRYPVLGFPDEFFDAVESALGATRKEGP